MSDDGLRVVVDVTEDGDVWTVRLHAPAVAGWSWPPPAEAPRRMRAGNGGGRRVPLPDPGWCAGGPDHRLCCAATGDTVAAAVAAVAARAAAARGADLGRLLYVALLGADGRAWQAVEQLLSAVPAPLELALRWGATAHDLTRLPWELLHDGRRFLATSRGDSPVAVTRVLAGTHATSRPMRVPPRVLFVVGTAVSDERVRPGAEIVGLLRAVRQAGVRIHHRLLYNASPERLAAAIKSFVPDVVHVIAHGGSGPQGPYLVLRADDTDERTEEQWYARRLAEQLTAGGTKPPVVVLSACETGALQMPGPGMATPFAVELVAEGVPVVAAMAGMVSDRACRLFTRRFGQALVAGRPIVAATAEARRLTFAADTADLTDWALPAVFLTDEDPPLRVQPDDGRANLIGTWISRYDLEVDPVFCGREHILSAFLPMLGDGSWTGWEQQHRDVRRRSVLAICAEESQPGVGKTRVLQEIARQALLDGHLPVLIGTSHGRPAPQTLGQLCQEVAIGIEIVREHIGLAEHLTTSEQLAEILTTHSDPHELTGRAGRYLRLGQEFRAVRAALAEDLATLVRQARERWPHLREGPGRVLLLGDNLGRASQDVLTALFQEMLTESGLGDPDEPIPVVLIVQAPGTVQELRQGQLARLRWLHKEELEPLSPHGGEDMRAYEQVMLHPFLGSKSPGITNLAWVFDRTLEEDRSRELARVWQEQMAGLPVRFTEGMIFPTAIRFSRVGRLVLPADDEDLAATE